MSELSNRESVKNTITIANNVAFPTLRKGKAFKALLFVASEVNKNLAPGSVHTVPLSLFSDLLKFKISSRDLAGLFEDLEKLRVDWSAYDSDYSGFSHVISSCRFDKKRDTISFSFDPMFVTEYLDKKTPFKNIPISLIMGFRSNYAMKIYELAYQFYDPKRKEGRTPAYDYQSLRALFSLEEDQYKNSGHFFQKVIRNPLREVEEISDYYVEFETNNKRGGLRRYWFTITLSAQAKFDFAKIDKDLNNGEDKELLLKKAEAEDQKRAIRFLEFWGSEFKDFSKSAMTDAERQMWVDPLLYDNPSLSTFAEFMLIDTKLRGVSEEKRRNYFQLPDSV